MELIAAGGLKKGGEAPEARVLSGCRGAPGRAEVARPETGSGPKQPASAKKDPGQRAEKRAAVPCKFGK